MDSIFKKRKNKIICLIICTLFILQFFLPIKNEIIFAGNNPSDIEIRNKIKNYASKYNIPYIILASIAYQESGWRQFDSAGKTVIGYNSDTYDIGIMQINSAGRSDSDISKLMNDIDYNIETGAKVLSNKWNITP
jgi:soluble lytic murein transglycosylase-like protein